MGGLSKFPVENFLSQNAGKIRRGTIQSFNKFGYRKKIPYRGLCHDFLCKKFLSHSAEKGRRGTFWSFINFGYPKFLGFKGLCHDSP